MRRWTKLIDFLEESTSVMSHLCIAFLVILKCKESILTFLFSYTVQERCGLLRCRDVSYNLTQASWIFGPRLMYLFLCSGFWIGDWRQERAGWHDLATVFLTTIQAHGIEGFAERNFRVIAGLEASRVSLRQENPDVEETKPARGERLRT